MNEHTMIKAVRDKLQKIFAPWLLNLSPQEKILFAKRLAVLISANVPILEALRMLKNQASSKNSAKILAAMIAEVENGQFLSSAMSRFNFTFGDFAVNIVRIGEISGNLNQNLSYLAEELKKKRELGKKIISALIYPGLIVTATLGITGLLAVYVLPKIVPVFQSFKTQLPLSTRSLIFFSNFVFHYWSYLLLAAAAAVFLAFLCFRLAKVKLYSDGFILRLPLLGEIFQSYYLANFCRTLGLLLKSEVRIEQAMQITAASLTNLAYRQSLEAAATGIIKGENISRLLATRPKLFPAMLTQMLAVGETAGNLSDSLLYLANFYEEELSDLTKNLSSAIEPALMIVMGVAVGFVAISIITPIYGITQNLHP